MEALAIGVPRELVWVPVDFEEESIADGLARGGVDSGNTFVSWLGVVPYLSFDAIRTTLRGLPPCSLAVSYSVPEETWPEPVRLASQKFGAIAQAAGEPPVSRFAPEQFASLLASCGFTVVEDVGPEGR